MELFDRDSSARASRPADDPDDALFSHWPGPPLPGVHVRPSPEDARYETIGIGDAVADSWFR